MSVESNLARAKELDDGYPDNVCPGCQQDITGWERFKLHYPPGQRSTSRTHHGGGANHRDDPPWPWARANNGQRASRYTCPWTDDYLTARAFRRAYIALHSKAAA